MRPLAAIRGLLVKSTVLVHMIATVACVAFGAPDAERVELQLTAAPGEPAPAGLALYQSDDRRGFREIGETDARGRAVVEVAHLQEPGRSGLYYRLTPHDPSRWTLSKATDRALPDVLAFFEDRRLAEAASQQVGTKWADSGGELIMVSEALPRRGAIRMQTQDVQGQPIRNHQVQLFARDRSHSFTNYNTVLWWGTTDERGQIELDQFAGIHNWIVCFPGLGHTQTGVLVFDGTADMELTLPRIVTFATIRGTVHSGLLADMRADERVCLVTRDAWRYREAAINSDGTFAIEDVPHGEYDVKLKNRETEKLRIPFVDPGEKCAGVLIEPKATPDAPMVYGQGPTLNIAGTFLLQGQVVEERGNPLPEARVFATVGFDGMRSTHVSNEAITNQRGQYQFEKVSLGNGSLAILAHVPGRPLAFAQFQFRRDSENRNLLIGPDGEEADIAPKGGAQPIVLTIPAVAVPAAHQGGSLRVRAVRDGKPVADAYVKLESTDFYKYFKAFGGFGSLPPDLVAALYRVQKTNSDGVAEFIELTPGLYKVATTTSAKQERSYWQFLHPAKIKHVAVAPATTRSVEVSLSQAHSLQIPYQVVHPDGTVLTNFEVATSAQGPGDRLGIRSTGKIDAEGRATIDSTSYGLWQLGVQYLSPAMERTYWPANTAPYFAGTCKLAVSRLMQRSVPVTFHTRLMAPATVNVTIEDEHGKPVVGVVELDGGRFHRSFLQETRSGSTDANGKVTFERVPSGRHRLSAFVPGWTAAVASLAASDTEFTGQFAVPDQFVEVSPGENITVQLRRQPVAYIRGKVIPAPGAAKWPRVDMWGDWTRRPLPSFSEFSSETGKYVLGPVLPGTHELVVESFDIDNVQSTARHKIVVDSPGVLRQDLPFQPRDIQSPWEVFAEVRGIVVAPDGKTPIYAARINGSFIGTEQPITGSWSDAQGKFALRDRTFGFSGRYPARDQSLKFPPAYVVAWLPGTLGATIVPLPEASSTAANHELKIVLPHQAALKGSVTVAGESPASLPAVITVAAHYRSNDNLGEFVDVTTTANVDGSYELAGLTPGEYDVQARLDGIWVSPCQKIVVPSGKPSSQVVDLDVLDPGDTAQYRLLDRDGTPLANKAVSLTSDELIGPLAQAIHGAAATETDAAGILYVEGLRAGTHSAVIAGIPFSFQVPVLGSPVLTPTDLNIGSR